MCALQAIDLLEMNPSKRLQEVKDRVRERIGYMPVDKYFGPDLEVAKELVKSGLGIIRG